MHTTTVSITNPSDLPLKISSQDRRDEPPAELKERWVDSPSRPVINPRGCERLALKSDRRAILQTDSSDSIMLALQNGSYKVQARIQASAVDGAWTTVEQIEFRPSAMQELPLHAGQRLVFETSDDGGIDVRNPSDRFEIRVTLQEIQLRSDPKPVNTTWSDPTSLFSIAPAGRRDVTISDAHRIVIETASTSDLNVSISNTNLIHALRVRARDKSGKTVNLGTIQRVDGQIVDGRMFSMNKTTALIVEQLPT